MNYIWIAFGIAGVVFLAMEETVDKIAIVGDKDIDPLASTFWRNFLFWIWICVFAAFGFLGHISFFFAWPMLVLAVVFIGSGFFYTYLLKKIELTSASAVSYASPFFYFIIDAFLLKAGFTVFQALGILLLTAGGMLFVIDPRRGGLRKEFTPKVLGIFVYDFLISGVDYYAFKYYFDVYHLNEVSYFFNVWFLMFVFFIALIAIRGSWRITWHAALDHDYIGKVAVSKFFDAASSYAWFHAIALSSVSQMNALNAFFPLALIAVVYTMQNLLGFKAEEEFSKGRLAPKLVAVIMLCVGGFFAR